MYSPSLGKPRILAIDDIDANLISLEAVLSRDNELIFAKSGPEALSILERRHDIDAILLDVQMPGMDGYDVAARIKKLPGCDEVPIIFITARFTEDPHIKRGYDVGAVDYFTKPFDPDLLRRKVRVYASFHRRATILSDEARERAIVDLVEAARKVAASLGDRSEHRRLKAELEARIDRLSSFGAEM